MVTTECSVVTKAETAYSLLDIFVCTQLCEYCLSQRHQSLPFEKYHCLEFSCL